MFWASVSGNRGERTRELFSEVAGPDGVKAAQRGLLAGGEEPIRGLMLTLRRQGYKDS